MFTLRPALAVLLWLAVGSNPGARGYRFFADRIPNGDHVPHPCKPNYLWQGVGHQNPLGGGPRNVFGLDFKEQGTRWTDDLCRGDSDGDGLTNGQELGDPDCVWTPNALPARTTNITHPGVCDPWDHARCREINTWVSCDVQSFHCDALSDPEVRNVTFRFPPTPVPNTETNYFCMTFDLPGDDTYHLVASEPVIDNADVMHHIIVYACDAEEPPTLSEPTRCGMESGRQGCQKMIALWGVGYAGTCYNPNTGFIFGRGEFTRIKMQFHWNNPELRTDYTDSSGVRFFFTPKLRPYSAATLMVGQRFLEIPPGQLAVNVSGTCSPLCTSSIISQPLYVIEGLNHMHYMGRKQTVELIRDNRVVALLTDDHVYSYDSPVSHVHNPPIQVLPGDAIRTTCQFSSKYQDSVTRYGQSTSAEMCYAFLTVYPREALSKTTTCLGFKDTSLCLPRKEADCDFESFLNASVPEVGEFMQNVSLFCHPFTPCSPQCAQTLLFLNTDPCMRGASLDVLIYRMSSDTRSLHFLSKMMSCWPRGPCSECSCGHDVAISDPQDDDDNDDNDDNNDNDDDDNDNADNDNAAPTPSEQQGEATCDAAKFLNSSSAKQFLAGVATFCPPFGACSAPCQKVMATMTHDPCLQGRGFVQLRAAMMGDLKSMRLMSQLMACQPRVPCPTCRQCPDDDDDNDDTANASALAPGVVGLVTVLVAALPLFN